jgi:hypothetical protein
MYLVRVESTVPVAGTVVRVLDDLSEHCFWFENEVFLRNHSSADCQYCAEETQVE